MTYQTVSGTVNAGAHPGSYNGQDAYNDLLVVDDGVFNTTVGRVQGIGTSINACGARLQKRNGLGARGGGDMSEPIMMSDRKGHNGITQDGTATTLTAQEKERPVCQTKSVVRRLTPVECERLQQFPDDWSKYGKDENGKVYELSNSARYKLQGNSIARPFWTWLLRRIGGEYLMQPTLGSLFDGQGGFPLCAVEAGIKPIWASEIEKNAVAVVRYHFGDEAMEEE